MSMTAIEVFVTLYAVFAIIGVSILIYLETPSGKRWMNGVQHLSCWQKRKMLSIMKKYYKADKSDIKSNNKMFEKLENVLFNN